MKAFIKITNITLSISLTLLFLCCSENFLDENNQESIKEQGPYENEYEAELATESCYEPLMYLFGYRMQQIYYGYSPYTVHEEPEFENMTFTSSYPEFENLYSNLYKGVYRCNLTKENIENSSNLEENIKNQSLAKCLYLRSIYNFYLALCFGTPPLVNKTLLDDFKGLQNSEEGALFAQCASDLRFAAEHLKLSSGGEKLEQISKGAAQAMLGKVYLWQEDWDSARYFFNEVILSYHYNLITPTGNDSVGYYSAFQSNFTWMPWNGYGGDYNQESLFEVDFEDEGDGWSSSVPGYGTGGSLLYKHFGTFGASYQNISAKSGTELLFEDAPDDHPAGLAKDPRLYVSLLFLAIQFLI